MTALFGAASLAAVAPDLGPAAHLLLAAILMVSLATGRLACRALRLPCDPMLATVTGFAALSHAMVLADLVVPGAHWQILALLGLATLPAWRGTLSRPVDTAMLGLGLLGGAFTFAWNHDVAARLAQFNSTGAFDFWLDGLVHAGNLAQFASPEAIGRGMILLADMPRALYHTASYMPPALLSAVLGVPPLEATMLGWLPLGILVMAFGVAALGLALGGPVLAAVALLALALVPAPERLSLGNGLLGFAWLLETAPGTPYSLGIAGAALASLARWMERGEERRWGSLALALALTASCFLIRVNTFALLAPAVGLAVLAGWPGLARRWRRALAGAGFLAFAAVLATLSWPALTADPAQFLFGYVDLVHRHNPPTRIDGLQAAMAAAIGPIGAGLLALPLTLLGLLGPWLPAFLILAVLARRHRAAADALPWLLLAAAMLEMLLAPMSRNGDITEFRHRAGPLVVVAIAVWSLRWAVLLARPWASCVMGGRGRVAWPAASLLCLSVLAATIGAAKRPAMAWGAPYHGTHVAPGLMALAPALRRSAGPRPRFAVANQPADARNIDEAAQLIALTGVPAYLSCPGFLVATGGAYGDEARRRLAVVAQLGAAPDLEALWARMRAEAVTHLVVTRRTDLPFDRERRHAAARSGEYALYILP
ncbi:hypothetical protein EJV46_07220 [Roseococcus sp. SYP-B2431]|uniref:hypothetical protein n=1 Tax=Roseococcus sp. SYP-B2431 TaxID=2496640 RepID=UPI00103BF0F2|nr:hypothetical protein [Roseococcus sp. SYP-B2431]TCI00415.1 hypothetical protein EJV46_07220 [Roseococcus sp. SYP-B2431]